MTPPTAVCEPKIMTVLPFHSLSGSGYSEPTFTDNSGAISKIDIKPSYFNFRSPITSTMNVTFTAFDYANNQNTCVIHVVVKGELIRTEDYFYIMHLLVSTLIKDDVC